MTEMGLETVTYISDLVAGNPTANDPKAQGDDHLRNIKAALKNTFPNVSGAATVTQAQLNYLASASGTTGTATGKVVFDVGATLENVVAKGTWTASGTWTLPALTLGGAITGNSQNISGLGTLGCGAITSTGAIAGSSLNIGTGALTAGVATFSGQTRIADGFGLVWGVGGYGATTPAIYGTAGVGIEFKPNGSTTGNVAVISSTGLAVAGNLTSGTHDGTNFLSVERYNSTYRYGVIRGGGSDLNTDVGLMFQTRGADGIAQDRLLIDASGNLLLNTTSLTDTNTHFLWYNTNKAFYVGHASGTASGTSFGVFRYNGTVIGSIDQNGTTGVLYVTSSDYRLKDIEGPVQGFKERVLALKPRQGSWKADGSYFAGFVAHEFQSVYPRSVTGEKDAVDNDGNPRMQAMQASSPEVIADIVAYVQNLEARLAALEAK